MNPSPADFPDCLRRALELGLPGTAARVQYAPELSYGRHDSPPAWNARRAAVVLLLYPAGGNWRIALTKRPETLQHHSGQVSLPGGEIEAGESPEEAALRELAEELGVTIKASSIVGRLTQLYVYASNFLVTPCVAIANERPVFVPNPAEVANLLEPTLVELMDPDRHVTRRIERRGVAFQAPEIVVADQSVWGATRLILAEFCAVLAGLSVNERI